MTSMQIISVAVFLLVMAAIVTEKIHRTIAAVAGAVLLIFLHILNVDDAVGYIDFNTIGVLVGIILAQVISYVTTTPVAISVPAAVGAVAFSMVIGIVFGVFPSYKAANLNPIDALRHE